MLEAKDKEHLKELCKFSGISYSHYYKVKKMANMFKATKISIDIKDKTLVKSN